MTIETKAIFENGILKPQKALPFAEHEEVHLRIESSPPAPIASPLITADEIEKFLDEMADDAPANLSPLPSDLTRADFYEDRG